MPPLATLVSKLACSLCARGSDCPHRVSSSDVGVPREAPCLQVRPQLSPLQGRLVVVVDDDAIVRRMLCDILAGAGARVTEYARGASALVGMRATPPPAAIIDLWLPGMDGFSLCRALRADPATSACALVVVTGAGDEVGEALGPAVGADDFIPKPFDLRSFLARMAAVIVRVEGEDRRERLEWERLVLDGPRRQALVDGIPLDLTPTGFAILYALARSPEGAHAAGELLGAGLPGGALEQLDLHVRTLQAGMGAAGACIQAVPGGSYRLAR